MPLTTDQRERVRALLLAFLARRLTSLEELTYESMTFNVIGLRASAALLELTSAEALMQYRLGQRLERGSSTSFGRVLQDIAREVGAQTTGVEGADLVVQRNGRNHYIQLKSGPEGFNRGMAQNVALKLNGARARDPGSVCVAAFCYGRRDQVQPMVVTVFASNGVELRVGREFWEFISGDPNTVTELLDLARAAAQEAPAGGLSFAERGENKVHELVAAFQSRYGETLTEDVWLRFLADNS